MEIKIKAFFPNLKIKTSISFCHEIPMSEELDWGQ